MNAHDTHATGDILAQINRKTGRNMPQAIATSIALVAIILSCIVIRIDAFVILTCIFSILALWELRADVAAANLYMPIVPFWICSTATITATFYSPWHFTTMACMIMISMLVCVIYTCLVPDPHRKLATIAAHKQAKLDTIAQTTRIDHIAVCIFVMLYVVLLSAIIIITLTFNHHPAAHAIMLIFLPALSDTGGLMAGALFGKHHLSPRISPKKSYEGLLGSIVFATAGAYVMFAWTYGDRWSSRWWVPLLAGIIVGVVGTFGDLCASMLKRDIGIKDMGHLLKGHGGVIDRVDSILICAPFLSALLWCAGM